MPKRIGILTNLRREVDEQSTREIENVARFENRGRPIRHRTGRGTAGKPGISGHSNVQRFASVGRKVRTTRYRLLKGSCSSHGS